MTALPDWMTAGITAADYEALPEDVSRRIEVVDGAVVVNASPSRPHQDLAADLRSVLKPQLLPSQRVSLDVDLRLRDVPLLNRRPDLVVYRADLPDEAILRAADCALVVEIVSPGLQTTDRLDKHAEYAASGIRQYWRVELDGGLAVHTFELEAATGRYESTGIFRDRLKINAPAAIDIDLADLMPTRLP